MSRQWMLYAHDGRHLGTYDGETSRDAISDFIRGECEHCLDIDDETKAHLVDRLVDIWGGRAVRVGSIPAMPAVQP